MVEFAVAAVEVDFNFAQRIDGFDQIFVGAFRPQDRDELQRGRQGLLGNDVLQQALERQAREILALEQRFERAGIGRADDQMLVEQEQAVFDRAQNVRGLLARLTQRCFLPLARDQQRCNQHAEHNGDEKAGQHDQPQLGGGTRIGRLQIRDDRRQLGIEQGNRVPAHAQRRGDVALQLLAASLRTVPVVSLSW